ncbi:MAG: cytochrome c oxidase subunit II [Verrucomicrobiia bacterium]
MLEKILGLPVSASEHAARVDQLILYVHVLMVVLFVGWILFFFYTLFRFRKSKNPVADYTGVKTHASSYLEATVAVVEVLLLVGLSIPFWSWKVSAFPTDPGTVHVRVIAQQFAWNIHYPGPDGIFGRTDIKQVDEQTNPIGLDRKGDPHAKDDIVTLNQLHLPVNRPAVIEITTKDVIHSFSLPVMRVKQDAIPGMLIPIHFVPNKTSDQLREELATTVTLPTSKSIDSDVAMEDYKARDGTILAKKGRSISTDTAAKLVENGITEVRVGPRYPAEIACAQLCGLGHYRMKGYLSIDTEEQYKAWLQDQEDSLGD